MQNPVLIAVIVIFRFENVDNMCTTIPFANLIYNIGNNMQ